MADASADTGPAWVELVVPNAKATCSFYGWLFDWKIDDQVFDSAIGLYAGDRLVLVVREGHPPTAWVPVFRVDDLPAARARALELGAAMERPTVLDGWSGEIWRDPEGAQFGIAVPARPDAVPHGVTRRELTCELNTRDLGRAADFYCRLLGARALGLTPDPFDYHLLVRDRRVLGALLNMTSFHDSATSPHWVGYVEVGNVAWAAARAAELGALVRVPPASSPFGEYAVLEDPDGILFGLGALPPPEALADLRVEDIAGGPGATMRELLSD